VRKKKGGGAKNLGRTTPVRGTFKIHHSFKRQREDKTAKAAIKSKEGKRARRGKIHSHLIWTTHAAGKNRKGGGENRLPRRGLNPFPRGKYQRKGRIQVLQVGRGKTDK